MATARTNGTNGTHKRIADYPAVSVPEPNGPLFEPAAEPRPAADATAAIFA